LAPTVGLDLEQMTIERSLVPKEDLAWIGHLHNEAMLAARAELRRAKVLGISSSDLDVCGVVERALSATAMQDGRFAAAAAFAKTAEPFAAFKERSRIPLRRPSTRFGREIAAQLDRVPCAPSMPPAEAASGSAPGDTSLGAASFLGGEEPVMPLDGEAEEALQEIEDASLDLPLPSIYSARIASIVSNASATVADSASLAVVLVTAAVADSSYGHWFTELPALAMSLMDGSEPDPCTATGLRPEARRNVITEDIKGALKGALKTAANPLNWLGGWVTAVPKIAGQAVVEGSSNSAFQSVKEATIHRRTRCPE
jgi:hypothetical protein